MRVAPAMILTEELPLVMCLLSLKLIAKRKGTHLMKATDSIFIGSINGSRVDLSGTKRH